MGFIWFMEPCIKNNMLKWKKLGLDLLQTNDTASEATVIQRPECDEVIPS